MVVFCGRSSHFKYSQSGKYSCGAKFELPVSVGIVTRLYLWCREESWVQIRDWIPGKHFRKPPFSKLSAETCIRKLQSSIKKEEKNTKRATIQVTHLKLFPLIVPHPSLDIFHSSNIELADLLRLEWRDKCLFGVVIGKVSGGLSDPTNCPYSKRCRWSCSPK